MTCTIATLTEQVEVGLLHCVALALATPPKHPKKEPPVNTAPRSILVALTAGTLVLTACGGGSDTATPESLPAVAEAGSATFNDADVLFAQGMVPHHREAVAMADMALAPEAGANAEIVALATQIQGAQDPEIEQMTALLESWGQPLDMPGMEGGEVMEGMEDGEVMEGMEPMEGMDGMMSAEEMMALAALSGAEFDTAWANAMIVHHEGAVSMSQTVKASGSNPEVLALADAIIAGQQAEIDQMKALVGG